MREHAVADFAPLAGLPLRDYEMCTSSAGGFDWDHRHPTQQLFREVSPAGIEPAVGFRVKSDLRNHCAIVQPRLYDSAIIMMVTQITGTLNLKERFHNRTFDVNRIHRLCASATVTVNRAAHVIFVQGSLSLSGVHWEG